MLEIQQKQFRSPRLLAFLVRDEGGGENKKMGSSDGPRRKYSGGVRGWRVLGMEWSERSSKEGTGEQKAVERALALTGNGRRP